MCDITNHTRNINVNFILGMVNSNPRCSYQLPKHATQKAIIYGKINRQTSWRALIVCKCCSSSLSSSRQFIYHSFIATHPLINLSVLVCYSVLCLRCDEKGGTLEEIVGNKNGHKQKLIGNGVGGGVETAPNYFLTPMTVSYRRQVYITEEP